MGYVLKELEEEEIVVTEAGVSRDRRRKWDQAVSGGATGVCRGYQFMSAQWAKGAAMARGCGGREGVAWWLESR